jgi:large subunit ribosomal protein L15
MQAHEIRPSTPKKARKRVGRGNGSNGTYSGKGMKGQKARAGGGVRPGFEGGQNPLIKGLPMLRGFTNPFRVSYPVVNVCQLGALGIAEVTPELLEQRGLIRHAKRPLKVLGDGEITSAVSIRATKFSASAKAKIEAAGGSVQEG